MTTENLEFRVNGREITMISVVAIVLAAGKGTRMNSSMPKVLHEVAGESMLSHVVKNLRAAGINQIGLVLSEEVQDFAAFLTANPDVSVCIQKERRGTADAVASAAALFKDTVPPSYSQLKHWRGQLFSSDHVLICAGDTPAIPAKFFKQLLDFHSLENSDLTVVGMKMSDPFGYGRFILQGSHKLERIVEHKDAKPEELKIDLCNSGIMIAKTNLLFRWLDKIKPNNQQGEYYLTDCVEVANRENARVLAMISEESSFFAGVNDIQQKMAMEQYLLARNGSL
jgi:bifunctional UDP-N-acetylglucosamine pyrophosphorylase/glucosamine-1-phosphate N-acetyltransferase